MLTHGGDIAGFVEEYGRAPLDFSANVSPLGLPEGVRRAVIESLDRADEYPDPLCRRLRRAIAAHEGCGPEEVLCGAGAADCVNTDFSGAKKGGKKCQGSTRIPDS